MFTFAPILSCTSLSPISYFHGVTSFFRMAKIIQLALYTAPAAIFHQKYCQRFNFFSFASDCFNWNEWWANININATKNNEQFLFFSRMSEWVSGTLFECYDANNPIYQCRIIYKTVPCEFHSNLIFLVWYCAFYWLFWYALVKLKTVLYLFSSPAGRVRY